MFKSIAKFFKSKSKVETPVELSDLEKKACDMFTVDAYVDYVVDLAFSKREALPTNIKCLEHIEASLYLIEKHKYEQKLCQDKVDFRMSYDVNRSEYVKWAVNSYKLANTEFTEINTELDRLILKIFENAVGNYCNTYTLDKSLFTIKEDFSKLTEIEYDKVDSEVLSKFAKFTFMVKSMFADNGIVILPQFYKVIHNLVFHNGVGLYDKYVNHYVFCLFYKDKKYFVTSIDLQGDKKVVYKRTDSRGCNW